MNWWLLLWAWLFTIPMMVGFWLAYHWYYQNAALADVGFCVGFALIVLSYSMITEGDLIHRVVITVMATGYATRLGVYISKNRIVNVLEDHRYQSLRKKWGTRSELYFFGYFIGQALAIVLFSIPLLVLMANSKMAWTLWEIIGILVWTAGVGLETMADYQLTRFRRIPQNKGKTCREGLWWYSRHPNYFFEVVHWFAYVAMGIGVSNGWLTLIGPVAMIFALLKVSGIPLAEAQALTSRGDNYREYQRTTSAFIPWFPKR